MDSFLDESTHKEYEPCKHDEDALRPGGALELSSVEALGILSQYAGVGIIMGVLEGMAYPVFQNYLHMEGYQSASYKVLINLGWYCMVGFGILSDCVPIFGFHRRSYMILGWFFCGASCTVMTLLPFAEPYYGKMSLLNHDLKSISTEDMKYINLDAPTSGTVFILLSMVASLGTVMAIVPSDAMVMNYAQREPLVIRGRVQTASYFARDTFTIIPTIFMGLFMNDFKYGGTYSWSLQPNAIYAMLIAPCSVCAFTAYYFVVEDRDTTYKSLAEYMTQFRHLMQQRVVWQLCIYRFLHVLCFTYASTVVRPMSWMLLRVQPMTKMIFTVLAQLARVAAMFAIGKFTLNWDWRKTIAINIILLIAIDAVFKLTATWNMYRNEYVFSIGDVLVSIPSAFVFLFSAFFTSEVADLGNEGLVSALFNSFGNLGPPFSIVIAKLIDSYFQIDLNALRTDTLQVRQQVTAVLCISFGVRALTIATLVLLPRQKTDVRKLKLSGGASAVAPTLLACAFMVVLSWGMLTNVMAVIPTTNCYRIAGGKGCQTM